MDEVKFLLVCEYKFEDLLYANYYLSISLSFFLPEKLIRYNYYP